jgi:ppGpp synthetase/RelA/SpoT-type nucleotidyltranferase
LNANFPDPPAKGWLLPPTWYSTITDVVRTTLVARYLDGIEALCKIISRTASTNGHDVSQSPAPSDAGYYAQQCVVTIDVNLPTAALEPVGRQVGIEIQVTTQAQEVIRKLLHRTYEVARLQARDDLSWQWDYAGRPFAANYLGHILHYVEGRVMNIRALDTDSQA